MQKTTTVTLAVKRSALGFDVLVAPTEDGVFWLGGYSFGGNRAIWREGETVKVRYYPEDQFAYEVLEGNK